jgi:hypothetical protein
VDQRVAGVPVIRVSTTLDPRLVEVAEQFVTHPKGHVRDFFVRDLASALQRTVEDWMTVMERAAASSKEQS